MVEWNSKSLIKMLVARGRGGRGSKFLSRRMMSSCTLKDERFLPQSTSFEFEGQRILQLQGPYVGHLLRRWNFLVAHRSFLTFAYASSTIGHSKSFTFLFTTMLFTTMLSTYDSEVRHKIILKNMVQNNNKTTKNLYTYSRPSIIIIHRKDGPQVQMTTLEHGQ